MTTITESQNHLTKYKPASTAELWSIAYPLMLTALSANLMLFMDRLLLSRFMPLAMIAVTTIGMIFTIFQFAGISIASIAEVFVGKYNGKLENDKIGPLVWQMIWFSLFSAVVFIPIGLFCGKYFLPVEYYQYGIPYFKTIMIFGPMFPLVAALSSFFIGRGKVKIITVTTIFANIINILFAYLFIFGVSGILPAMGAFGAALAGGSSISIQAILLFLVFLQKKNREQYGTNKYSLIFSEFWRCIAVGAPNAMGYVIEMSAWACLLQIMAHKDNAHIMVLSIGQALFLLLAFTTDGLQKSIVAIASNTIGGQRWNLMPTLIKSGLKLHGLMILCFAIPLLFYPETLVKMFFSGNADFSFQSLVSYAKITCLWILVYFIFDGLVWIFAGILIAFEDTFFVMAMNATSVWLLAILPNYIAIVYFNTSPSVIWELMSAYALINAIGFSLRYAKVFNPYKNKCVTQKV